MLYDTHAHLDMIKESYLDDLIKNAKEAKVKTIVTQSVNLPSMEKSLKISKAHKEIVKLSVGLYPGDIKEESDFDKLKEFVEKNKEHIFAIGEIGMDFTYEKPSKEVQEKVFRKQLQLAKELNVPVSIHTRKAEKEIVEILKDYPEVKKILHCFSGKKKLALEAEKDGCFFSIPTNIVRSQQFKELVKELPREKILTETDTPYLSPFRDKDNEPAFITETIKVLSGIWEVSIKEAESQIENNFNRLYL